MAEGVGFEPTVGDYPTPVFETGSLSHSDTPPCGRLGPRACGRADAGKAGDEKYNLQAGGAPARLRVPIDSIPGRRYHNEFVDKFVQPPVAFRSP